MLHNDKWDRKAKRNYMRKHGIAQGPRQPTDGEQPQEPELESNLWRYQREQPEDDNDEGEGEAGSGEEQNEAEEAVERVGVEEIDFFPEAEDDDDDDDTNYAELAREKIKERGLDDGLEIEQKNKLSYVKDSAEFEEMRQDIDRLNMVRQIKKRFGSAAAKTGGTGGDDDDFDSFLAEVDAADAADAAKTDSRASTRPTVAIDDKKQAWLDGLLG